MGPKSLIKRTLRPACSKNYRTADDRNGLETTLAKQASRLAYHAQDGFITVRFDLMSLAQTVGLIEFAMSTEALLGSPHISIDASLHLNFFTFYILNISYFVINSISLQVCNSIKWQGSVSKALGALCALEKCHLGTLAKASHQML